MEGIRLQPTQLTGVLPSNQCGGTAVVSKLRKTKKKKKRDPHEPQKPVSAYALFFRDTQSTIKLKKPDASFGEISKLVASMWDNLEQDAKMEYKRRTEAAKKEYLRKLAAYKARMVSREIPLGYSSSGAAGYMGCAGYYSQQHVVLPPPTQPNSMYYYPTNNNMMQQHQYPQHHQMSPNYDDGAHYMAYPQYMHPQQQPQPTMELPLPPVNNSSPYHPATSPDASTSGPTDCGSPMTRYVDNVWQKKTDEYSALSDDPSRSSVRDIYYWMSRSDRELGDSVM